jgi:hypothetical protein
MGRMPWAVYVWPGLPQIWRRGDWSGLVLAVVFAVLVNAALASGLVWTELELFIPAGRSILWLAIVAIWVGSALLSIVWDRRHPDYPNPEPSLAAQDTYGEVLGLYLQQNWYEAERLVAQLLRRNGRDVDARLMLASVLRHERRFDEAAGQLDRLGRIEGSRKWDREMRRERALLAQAVAAANEPAGHRDAPAERKQAA